jgi:uncharacterized protein YjiS (DUF1127 family)
MTYQTASEQFSARIPARGHTNSTAPFLTARRAMAQLGNVLASIGDAIMRASEASSRIGQIEALRAKSDAELAQIGITRDEIVHYVFKDLFYV